MRCQKAFWLLFGVPLLAAPARAADATLRALSGKAYVRSAGAAAFRPARAGQKLRRDDTLRTGDGAVAQVVFKSGATVLVKEKSRFSLRADKTGEVLTFVRGEFLIGLRRKLKDGRKFEVRTPACVAAVRGTVFWGLSDENKKSTYACFTGAIDVTAQGKTAALRPGEKLEVAFGAAPGPVRAADIPADYVDTFAVDQSLQGVDEMLQKSGAE